MLSESINCLTIKAGFAAMESSRAFWWVKVKGSGSSIMIYEEELAKTKNAYNILEMAKCTSMRSSGGACIFQALRRSSAA